MLYAHVGQDWDGMFNGDVEHIVGLVGQSQFVFEVGSLVGVGIVDITGIICLPAVGARVNTKYGIGVGGEGTGGRTGEHGRGEQQTFHGVFLIVLVRHSLANAFSAALMVSAISASVCALLTKPASNA